MAPQADCTQNTDPFILIREGTSQAQRLSPSLDPGFAPVNERRPEHAMAFAMAYSAFLRYYDAGNVPSGDWTRFFNDDPSVRLAVAAIQDVELYRSKVKECFDFLRDNGNSSSEQELKNKLGSLFGTAGTLARQLDGLKEGLPAGTPLAGTVRNLIQGQLAPALSRLLSYYKYDLSLPTADRLAAEVAPDADVLGGKAIAFGVLYNNGVSHDWITDGSADWVAYRGAIAPDGSVFGAGGTVFDRINHLATHNLFTSVFDRFLKALARVVADAGPALTESIEKWDRHEPHYALFLSYLRLFEYARAETNTLTGRHLDFYYREILRLREKPPMPGRAHMVVELAKQAPDHQIDAGEPFKAGKDGKGNPAFFASVRDVALNQASVASLMSVYRHGSEQVGTSPPTDRDQGRLFASPVANSDDGLGAPLTSVDQSWQPFSNKIYSDGILTEIRMPKAESGFAIASHYLLLAEGKRDVTIDLTVSGYVGAVGEDWSSKVLCSFTGEKGWIDVPPVSFQATGSDNFSLAVSLAGDAPAVVPCDQKLHGLDLQGAMPVLRVTLVHQPGARYSFPLFEDVEVRQVRVRVNVEGIKRLTLSNDAGPVDPSKPFLPFGPQPEAASAFLLSSSEVFIKENIERCDLTVQWKNKPGLAALAYLPYEQYLPSPTYDAYKQAVPGIFVSWLKEGAWGYTSYRAIFEGGDEATVDIAPPPGSFNRLDRPDVRIESPYAVTVKSGYVRCALAWGLGHKQYRDALAAYVIAAAHNTPGSVKPTEPYTPEIASLSVGYSAVQVIPLASAEKEGYDARTARLYHVTSFGQAEQHPWLKVQAPDRAIYLFPQLRHLNIADRKLPAGTQVRHAAELYIGIAGLKPPQNLPLLFEAADGTADPLLTKPDPHIHWSYLRGNEWFPFANNEVEDGTGGLLNSGIITFAVPREASDANSILQAGMHWIRAAVGEACDAVCRQRLVAAQGMEAAFTDRGNDPSFPAAVLPPGTITKLERPDAAVKKVTQPFSTFGGRGAELPTAFYTRVSERVRHKDRGIALWDYERLVLEAFPQIYRAKCLNHTHFEPNDAGTGTYRELAPGHVTVVTIPDLQFSSLRNPLRPYTSLGLLEEIGTYLRARLSCLVTLHVKNPQCEEVRVQCRVRLQDGVDETLGMNRLKEEMTRFLSPWAFPGGGSPSFGGKIQKSVLINFVEERAYVDYVTDFQMFHDINGVQGTVDSNEIEGSRAVSLLVSVPARRHAVTVIHPWEQETSREQCPCEA